MSVKEIFVPRIVNAGNSEMVDVTSIKCHPRNVNHGDRDEIKALINTHGFYGSLIVQKKTRYILAGNHRYMVAVELGYRELPIMWADVDDTAAKQIMLADNASARKGHDDQAKLAELLSEISNQTGTLMGTGYTSLDLDRIIGEVTKTTDQTLSVAANVRTSQSFTLLKIGNREIPLTGDEAERINLALDSWIESNGSSYGFINALLTGDV